MLKTVKSRAEEQFTATQKKADQALKEKTKVPQERAEFAARFRALRVTDLLLRLDKEAADKEAADEVDAKKVAGQNGKGRRTVMFSTMETA